MRLDQLSLLASAVAGRAVAVAAVDRERGHTDGRTIFVPPLPPALIEPAVVVQASLMAVGSFDPALVGRLTAHRRLRSRYLTLEAARAAASSPVLPPRVAAMVEDTVPGRRSTSAAESLAWAQDRSREIPDPPVWFGELRPGKLRRVGPSSAQQRPTAAANDVRLEEATEELDPDGAETSRVLELFSMPGSSPLSAVFRKLLGMGRSPGGSGGGGGDSGPGQQRGPNGTGEGARKLMGSLPSLTTTTRPSLRGARYPEWDVRRGVLRPDRCAVREFDPPLTTASSGIPAAAEDRALRRQLAALGHSIEYRSGQESGDVLDLNALVDLVADRAAGESREARIYAQPRRTGRDLGVLVILDATASSADTVAGLTQFDEHRLIVDRLAGALENLGNPVAVFGFTSAGPEDVRFLRVKAFVDRYDHHARERLSRVEPHGFTRLGAAIRHGTAVLERQAGTTRRLLVMVGDGLPYETGYEGDYAEADSRHALAEAVARGVGCVRISVDAGLPGHPCVERIWGDLPQTRLPSASALAGQVRPLFAQAVRSAAASTRPIRNADLAPAPRRRVRGVSA